jgi:ADP-ribose pyrophosphatase YjhB (NUDIX family)
MLQTLLGKIWRHTPATLRRLSVRLIEPRFRVTAGAVIVDEAGRVLLLKHVLRKGSGWGIPGGFLEQKEQPEEAIRRELREEVGLELKSVRIAFARTLEKFHQVEIIYLCRPSNNSEPVPRSIEISQVEWFQTDALPPELSAEQHRLIHRALTA